MCSGRFSPLICIITLLKYPRMDRKERQPIHPGSMSVPQYLPKEGTLAVSLLLFSYVSWTDKGIDNTCLTWEVVPKDRRLLRGSKGTIDQRYTGLLWWYQDHDIHVSSPSSDEQDSTCSYLVAVRNQSRSHMLCR